MGFEYPDHKWAELLRRVAAGQSVSDAAKAVGVARGSVYVRAQNNSAFRDQFDAVRNGLPIMRNHTVEMWLRDEKGELILDNRFEPIPITRRQFLRAASGGYRKPKL
ncbi:helix-turn-helix domain-containing protein [Gemmobacter fulvus]|uniref:Helix-turn-helix domain-containing protein n=1 Tax=Gemmobacter fulvus TaxID=2840474 RepID=A0A975S293_9RHOB|nr:helix-turn-helix domain-containing protein [Gemmobacter fulvus]QWK90728.1 helix-turn-helix domain-containing protein [Gemmobacter fulvus]